MSNLLKMMAGAGIAAPLYSSDVFSAYTYTGNGSTQTITNGIDLAGEGGMVWTKRRNGTNDHQLVNTTQGAGYQMQTNTTVATEYYINGVSSFTSSGYTLGDNGNYNSNFTPGEMFYASWTFRNSDRFFNHASVVKSSGSDATASFTGLGTIGMVAVKRTDSTGNWYVFHRSCTAGKLLYLNLTDAEATLGHITVSGTTVTLVDAVIADGTYIVYAWAHDTEADGIIQCGSFTTDGSGNATVALGWEPQFILYKVISSTGNNKIFDTSRQWSNGSADFQLYPDASAAENTSFDKGYPTATGFFHTADFGDSQTFVYLAIRRPNKPPTVGTQVYNAIARTGTGAAATVTGVGFAPDLVISGGRSAAYGNFALDRLRGTPFFKGYGTDAETVDTDGITAYLMDGIAVGTYPSTNAVINYIYHFFRRAPGVHDQICTTGTGANKTEAHNLTVAPELWLHKGRSGATEWVWGGSLLANTQKIVMPSPAGVVTDATAWNSTFPTASVISFGTAAAVNTTSATYTSYLWATLTGISKVFTYTGDGGSGKVIDCGFTTGARFVMIIRTTASTAQDIFIWDTVRGIVAGNDPHLSLNTTAAEVTTDDSIDPDSSGFAINQVAATNINVSGAVYIGVAYA